MTNEFKIGDIVSSPLKEYSNVPITAIYRSKVKNGIYTSIQLNHGLFFLPEHLFIETPKTI